MTANRSWAPTSPGAASRITRQTLAAASASPFCSSTLASFRQGRGSADPAASARTRSGSMSSRLPSGSISDRAWLASRSRTSAS